ncbi:MAG: ABC transporter substrate-binding protein [Kiritimatiellia bacterium]
MNAPARAAIRAGMALCSFQMAVSGATFRRPLERVASMDPIRAAAVYDARAVSLVYEPPLEIDYFARPYRLKAGLCDLPDVSEDGRVYTFRIRPGARFQPDACFPEGKGRAVVADDIVYSLKRLGDRKNASNGMWMMNEVKDVEAVDARTARVTLKKPFHVFPWLMAMAQAAAVPREAVEKYGVRFGGVAVGSGPYRMKEWWRNHRMVFERDPSWRGWPDVKTKPYDKIEFYVVDDAMTKWLMFIGGQTDFLEAISKDNWDAVVGADGRLLPELERKGLRLYHTSTLTVLYVGINMNDPVLGTNRKLRQALNCAFDFETWNRVYNNRMLPCDGPLPPGVEGRLETPFAYSFNLEKARRLLAEAGYAKGVDPKTGKRLEISLSIGRATQEAREQVELMQSFYEKIGIRLEPRFMTWDAYQKAVNKGNVTLFMMGWLCDYPDAENFLQLFISKNVSPGMNHCNYRNPEVDRLYDEAMEARDKTARLAAWRRIQEIVREDCPWIFMHVPKLHSMAWQHVGNYIPSDFPYGSEKHLYDKGRAGR